MDLIALVVSVAAVLTATGAALRSRHYARVATAAVSHREGNADRPATLTLAPAGPHLARCSDPSCPACNPESAATLAADALAAEPGGEGIPCPFVGCLRDADTFHTFHELATLPGLAGLGRVRICGWHAEQLRLHLPQPDPRTLNTCADPFCPICGPGARP